MDLLGPLWSSVPELEFPSYFLALPISFLPEIQGRLFTGARSSELRYESTDGLLPENQIHENKAITNIDNTRLKIIIAFSETVTSFIAIPPE